MAEESSRSHYSRNARLFTTLGVFGAISVYFTQLQLSTQWQRLGIVSSLSIFLLIAVEIQRNLPPASSDKAALDYVLASLSQKPGTVVFYVCFWLLVVSVAAIVTRYSNTLLFLLLFIFFIGGFALAKWIVDLFLRAFDEKYPDEEIELGNGNRPVVFASYIVRNGLYAVILGLGGLALGWVRGLFVLSELAQFRSPGIVTSMTAGISSGLATGGSVFVTLALLLLLQHFMIIRIRKRNLEGEVQEWMDILGFDVEADEKEDA